jgi:hypothetical protein
MARADAKRDEAEHRAGELVAQAEAKAAELSAASARDREEALTLFEQADADRAEAEHRAAELMARADADRADTERRAVVLIEQAEATAAEIVDSSRREHEQITWSMEEARQQVDRLSDQVRTATSDGAQAVMDGLRPHVEDLRQQYKDLETERRAAVMRVGRVRESLRVWAKQVASDGESA